MMVHVMSFITRSLSRIGRQEQGGVAIFVGVGIAVAAAATMFTVEMSRYTNIKTVFRNSVDQALLAAASRSSSTNDAAQMQLTAEEYFRANQSKDSGFTLNSFRVMSGSNKTWRAEASGTLNGGVSKILGIESLALKHTAEVGMDSSTQTELVAMIDLGGTMCAQFDRSPDSSGAIKFGLVPDRACTKLVMVRNALRQVIDKGVGYSTDGGEPLFKVGIVPFTYKVNLPNPAAVPEFLIAAEKAARAANPDERDMGDPSYFTDVSDAEIIGGGRSLALPSVIPLTPILNQGSKDALIKQIDSLLTNNLAANEFNRRAWKRSSLGAQISGMMLDPRYNAMFGGERPSNFGTPNKEKIVIMMTDAANIGCCFTNWPPGNFRSNYLYSYSLDHQHLTGDGSGPGICQQMKDEGIKIYTVLLDVDPADMNERGGEIIEAFEKCASDPRNAFRVPINDEEALKDAYTRIAGSLLKLKLTY